MAEQERCPFCRRVKVSNYRPSVDTDEACWSDTSFNCMSRYIARLRSELEVARAVCEAALARDQALYLWRNVGDTNMLGQPTGLGDALSKSEDELRATLTRYKVHRDATEGTTGGTT